MIRLALSAAFITFSTFAFAQSDSTQFFLQKGLTEKQPGDLLSLDIRRSLHYLGEITGEITNEDQLDYIFSKFCIGK